MQMAFARAYVLNGGKGTLAALEAGYSEGAAPTSSVRNLRHPHIIAEIKRLAVFEVGSRLPDIISRLFDILDSPTASEDTKARILLQLMDRGGMPKQAAGPSVQVNVQVNGSGSSALIQEIWASKAARELAIAAPLSAIDGSMTDELSDDGAETIEATATLSIDAPGDEAGG
jgi:hypothetical protein